MEFYDSLIIKLYGFKKNISGKPQMPIYETIIIAINTGKKNLNK